MHSSLRWGLGCTLVLSGVAVWWPHDAPVLVAAKPRDALRRDPAEPRPVAMPAATDLPDELPDWRIEPARRDPFAVTPPATAPEPAKAAPPPAPSVTAPPVLAAAPPISLRYLGTMVTPEGKRLVMLARGQVAVPVEAGAALEEGYVVQSVERDAVRLVYPALGTEVTIPIPEASVPER